LGWALRHVLAFRGILLRIAPRERSTRNLSFTLAVTVEPIDGENRSRRMQGTAIIWHGGNNVGTSCAG